MASRVDEGTGPSPRKAAALINLAHLDDLLAQYANATPYQGGFLGFKVTFGFIRYFFHDLLGILDGTQRIGYFCLD